MTEPNSTSQTTDPDPSPHFDFNAFLETIDPTQHYTIVRLHGGLINITVRATRSFSTSKGTSRFEGHQSIILKHAPPYVATIGEEAPFSTYRQVIEARALKLLEASPGVQASQALTRTSIPRLLHEDHIEHVLVLEDLGNNLSDIDKWLSRKPQPSKDLCENVGERLGSLLAVVHGISFSFEDFKNPDVGDMLANEVVGRMGEMLEQFGVPDGERPVLCQTIKDEFWEGQRSKGRGAGVFSVGDLWTGSILLSEDAERLCIIDWEFAGEARPLQDMAQLAAHLHLQAMADSSGSVLTFASALHRSYHSQTKAISPPWFQLPLLSIIRSAWILHGREIIYNAVDRNFHVVEGETSEKTTARKKEMVETGIWYIRTAKEGLGSADLEGERFLRDLYWNASAGDTVYI